MRTFNQAETKIVSHAVEIAEDVTANYFKISTAQWKNVRYDIRLLDELSADEITESAFAQITRYSRNPDHTVQASRHYDFFKICLQDHNMTAAVERDEPLHLFPLTVYVVTHELVHVVRFSKFLQRFDADAKERQREEARVHGITQNALGILNLPNLAYVLRAYKNYQFMEELSTVRV
ncbi:MAG: hypothetical protein JSU72_13600 [Deltaproteobacteria bacterium]|nr:MAG: hypothetical protein JSU72_13600 [Deltaproteobacteria bacterium]